MENIHDWILSGIIFVGTAGAIVGIYLPTWAIVLSTIFVLLGTIVLHAGQKAGAANLAFIHMIAGFAIVYLWAFRPKVIRFFDRFENRHRE